MYQKKLFTIFLVVFVDLLGFSLLIPLLPFYAKAFDASDTVVGLLLASYAAAQFFGAPVLGRLSDRYGRRPVLLVSIFGTIISLIVTGLANTLLILFAARIIDGLTGGNISVAQAYISDVTDEKNRAKGLGMIGAAFGLGFIIGPAIGGGLSALGTNITAGGLNWAYALPAFVAATIATLNWLAVYRWLPESLSEADRAEMASRASSQKRAFNLQALMATFRRPLVGPLLSTRFTFSLAFAIFQSIFALYALYRLDLGPTQTAFILTYVGILVAVVQGVLIGKLTERFEEKKLLFWSTGLMTVSLLGWAATPSVPVLLVVLIPLSLSGGVFSTVINSALTKAVNREEMGGILGISASLESVTRILAPTLGGLMLEFLGTAAPGIIGAVLVGLLIPYVWRHIMQQELAPLTSPAMSQQFTSTD